MPDIWFIDAKLAGVIAMFGAPMVWLFLPWLDRSRVRSASFRPLSRIFFWVLVIDCIVLGVCGANSPEGHWLIIAQVATAYYFLHFLFVIPLISSIEKPRALPTSISKPVLKPASGFAQPAAST